MTARNVYEAEARALKVARLVDAAVAVFGDEATALVGLADGDPLTWGGLAAHADVRPPSTETIRQAIDRLRDRQTRPPATLPDDWAGWFE